MGRKRFSAEQIIVMLREAEVFESKGLTQAEAAKKLGVDQTPKVGQRDCLKNFNYEANIY